MKKYIPISQIQYNDTSLYSQMRNIADTLQNVFGGETKTSMIEPDTGDKVCYWFYWFVRSAAFLLVLIPLMLGYGLLSGISNALNYVKNLSQWDDTTEDPDG